jgi:hypothetical protein
MMVEKIGDNVFICMKCLGSVDHSNVKRSVFSANGVKKVVYRVFCPVCNISYTVDRKGLK